MAALFGSGQLGSFINWLVLKSSLLIIRSNMRGVRGRQSGQEAYMYNNIPNSYYRNPENPRLREYARPGRGNVCNYCSCYHYNDNDKCYFVCLYCHGIHFKKNLIGSNKIDKIPICPMLKDNALQQQNKKAYACEACGGYGCYEKIIQTTYVQPKAAFQKRMAEYQKRRSEGKVQMEVPLRKIFKNAEQSKQEMCQSCYGKGKIYKMTHCCQNGCPQCGFTRIKINPKWMEIRSRGQANDEVFPCRICSKEVEVGGNIFKLQCGHTFHKSCIFAWLYMKEGCYTCGQVDLCLQKMDFSKQNYEQIKLIQMLLISNYQKGKEQKATRNKLAKLAYMNEIMKKSQIQPHSPCSQELIQKYCKLQKQLQVSANQPSVSSPLNTSDVQNESWFSSSIDSYTYMKQTRSQRQVSEHQNSEDESLMIVRVPSQTEQRGLSLDLSIIIRKQSEQVHQNMAATNIVENQNANQRIEQAFSFKEDRQQFGQQASQVEEKWPVQ